jgi:hypothetical protein
MLRKLTAPHLPQYEPHASQLLLKLMCSFLTSFFFLLTTTPEQHRTLPVKTREHINR